MKGLMKILLKGLRQGLMKYTISAFIFVLHVQGLGKSHISLLSAPLSSLLLPLGGERGKKS